MKQAGPAASGRLLSGMLAGLLLLAGAGMAAGTDAGETDYIPLAEIEPGMTGYGLTVFAGTRIDTFGVQVVGIQDRIRAAGSLLVIEVSGHDLETSSIAQGMSGSPIFIDGRFAGALAFGWPGALRPLAGVTPAAEILALPTQIPVTTALSAPQQTDLRTLLSPSADAAAIATMVFGQAPNGSAGLEQDSAVAVSAGNWPSPDQLILDLMDDLLPVGSTGLPRPENWICLPTGIATGAGGLAVTGAESGSAGPEEAPLLAGSACAIPLVSGDAQLGVTGTVTWVDGDQVFMMGHPFMQRGPVHLPLATARVLTVFPSRQMSFKMASIGEPVGAVHHDQRAGLSGRLGEAPAGVPVDVAVRWDSLERDYSFSVVDDPLLTPTLVFWALYNALLVEGDDQSRQTLRYRIETTWEGPASLAAEPLVISGVTAGPGGALGLASEWMGPLAVMLGNPYQSVRLTGVRAELELSRPMATAEVVGVSGPRSLVVPGKEALFTVEIEPRRGDPMVRELSLAIPEHLAPGRYMLVVASAAELFALEAQRAAGRFQPVSLEATLDILKTERSPDTLVLAVLAPGRSMIIQGQELTALPGSVSRLLRKGNRQAVRTLADYVARAEQKTPWVLRGHAVQELRVVPAGKPITEERRP